jgi:uncharacterized phosphosugar-binding protein
MVEPDGIDSYFEAIQELQARVVAGQRALLRQVAAAMVTAIEGNGRIFTFGAGHSHLLAEEGHFRAGGLAPVVPILFSGLMFHESARFSSQLEQLAGLARPLLDRYQPCPGEMIFIFSNSGVNLVPLEMAVAAKEKGLVVVGVCSLAYARVATCPTGHRPLFELADYVLDNGGEPGDSLIPLPGTAWRVGPSSTVIGALLWNCLVTEVAFRLQARSAAVPIYISGRMPGSAEYNAPLVEQWHSRNPHM